MVIAFNHNYVSDTQKVLGTLGNNKFVNKWYLFSIKIMFQTQ